METLLKEKGKTLKNSFNLVLYNRLRSWGLFPTKIPREVGGRVIFNPPSGEEVAFQTLSRRFHPGKKNFIKKEIFFSLLKKTSISGLQLEWGQSGWFIFLC